jgi:hypothetical protein
MSAYLDRLEELTAAAQDASNAEDTAAIARRENQVVGDACEAVGELSANGDISKAEKNQLAGVLSDELAQYTKTDLKNEFDDYFQREQSGTPFDKLIEDRLEEIVVIKNTDHRQGAMFRWHFSDGVQLETETTEEGTRLHRAWQQFKELYFEARVAAGEGERIADPTQERRDSDQWREFVNDLILDHATTVEHVGPRTEAVRQLRDHIERHAAYTDMDTVRNRAGVGIDADADTVDDLDANARIHVPTQDIKRICDQVGITTRALQVELDARGLTADGMAGVSDATYCNGERFPFWVVTAALAEPATITHDADSAAEQAAQEQAERRENSRTSLGATGGDDGDGDDDTDDDDSAPAPAVDGGGPDDPPDDDDYDPGLNESLGTDPENVETDGGEQ